MKLGELVVDIGANTRGLVNGLRDADRAVGNASSGLGGLLRQGLATGVGMQAVSSAVSAVSNVFKGTIGAGLGMNSMLQTTTLQFETLMGDAGRAKEHVADLFTFAKKTPFETEPIIQASRMMRTFGGDVLDTKENLQLIGDSAAATSAPIQDLGFWTGRMYAAIKGGQPFGEAAMRLQELAVLTPEARKKMEDLAESGASADEVFAVFQEHMKGFSGAMEKQASTWSGLTSTLSDTFKLLAGRVFEPFFKRLSNGLKWLVDATSGPGFEKAMNKFIGYIEAGLTKAGRLFGKFSEAVKPPLQATWSVVQAAFGPLTKLIQLTLGLASVGEMFAPSYLNGFGRALQGPQQLVEILENEVYNALVDTFGPQTAGQIALWAGRVAGTIAVLVGGATEAFKIWAGTIDLTVDAIRTLADVVSNIPGVQQLIDWMLGVGGTSEQTGDKIGLLSKTLGVFIAFVGGAYAISALATFTTNLVGIGKAFVWFPFSAAEKALNQVRGFVQAATGLVSKTITITQNVVTQGAELIKSLPFIKQEVTQLVKRNIQETVTKIETRRDALNNFLKGIQTGLAQGIGQAIDEVMGELGAKLLLQRAALSRAIMVLMSAASSTVAAAAPLLFNPITLIIVGAIVAGFLIYKYRHQIMDGLSKLKDIFEESVLPVLQEFFTQTVPDAIVSFFQPRNLGKRLADLFVILLFAMFPVPLLIIHFRKQIGDFFKGAGEALVGGIKGLPGLIQDNWKWILLALFPIPMAIVLWHEQITEFGQKAAETLVSIATDYIPNFIGDNWLNILTALFPIPMVIARWRGEIGTFGKEAGGSFLDILTNVIPNFIADNWKLIVAALWPPAALVLFRTEIYNALTTVGETIFGWVRSLGEWMEDNFAPWNWVKQAWDGFVDRIGEWLHKIWGSGLISEWLDDLANWFTDHMQPWDWAEAAFDLLVRSVSGKLDEVITFLSDLPGRAIDALGDLTGSLWQKGIDLITGLWNGAVLWSDEHFEPWLRGLPDEIKGWVGDLGNILWWAGMQVINGFWGGMKQVWNSVSGWLGDRKEQIKNLKGPIEQDRQMLRPQGEAVMEGFLSGLRRGWDNVSRFLGEKTTDVRRIMKHAMAEQGEYLAQLLLQMGRPDLAQISLQAEAGLRPFGDIQQALIAADIMPTAQRRERFSPTWAPHLELHAAFHGDYESNKRRLLQDVADWLDDEHNRSQLAAPLSPYALSATDRTQRP